MPFSTFIIGRTNALSNVLHTSMTLHVQETEMESLLKEESRRASVAQKKLNSLKVSNNRSTFEVAQDIQWVNISRAIFSK